MTKQEPITLTKEEIEAIEIAIDKFHDYFNGFKYEDQAKTLLNLLERTKNNNEQSDQMEIAREIMKQDSECLKNLSKNNDDSIKNFDS